MKSKDVQKIVQSKYEKDETPSEVYHDLNGALGLRTIKRWFRMIRSTGSIALSASPGGPRLVRTTGDIEKVKDRLERNTSISTRVLSRDLGISRTTTQRILKEDLGLKPSRSPSHYLRNNTNSNGRSLRIGFETISPKMTQLEFSSPMRKCLS